jgi:hypothetical protein
MEDRANVARSIGGSIISAWGVLTSMGYMFLLQAYIAGIAGVVICNLLTWVIWQLEPASYNLIVADVLAGLLVGFPAGYFIIGQYGMGSFVKRFFPWGVMYLCYLAFMWYCGMVVELSACHSKMPLRATYYPRELFFCP